MNELEVAEVCLRYQQGESSILLAQRMGVSSVAIRGLLDRRGIKRRSVDEAARKYTMNHEFFQQIDTEAKAYWLGFFAADGCVTDDGTIRIHLASQDESHLYLFRKAISSTHPIKQQENGKYLSSSISVYSPTMANDLLLLGITPRNTHTLRMPNCLGLNKQMTRHFARGYIDGDGGFYLTESRRKEPGYQFSVTSNETFIQELQTFLCEELDLSRTKVYRRNKLSAITTMSYCGKQQLAKIARWLYKNTCLYMERKREKIEHIL